MTMTACGLAWSFGYYNWSLWGMWIAEGVFLLGKIILNNRNFNSYLIKQYGIFVLGVLICSCVAACRIGCWCCIDDNLIEPLTVIDEDTLLEGQANSAQVMVDQNQNATVVNVAEPAVSTFVDSTNT